uniref:Immunoglobulin-like beta-sandwich domain-containing protein n=1 Tax=Equus asinus asinus TaxID=83772 RepID=A0A8C4MV98_EQUAS
MGGKARTPTLTFTPGVCGLTVPPLTQLPPSPSGVYSAPSLSAHPGPVVAKGGNVFLTCSSESTLGIFHLLKEGEAHLPQHMESRTYRGRWQALFPVGPVNTSHGGTYKCYGSSKAYPYVWSLPSNLLHLEVTGEEPHVLIVSSGCWGPAHERGI